ncbi:MAG TPA: glutathione S-transferase family protein [Gaiellales bacterium]|jgi:glutathione S-transferase|nr:glutathione S-transferase family protein [Gaiellales bacterium]
MTLVLHDNALSSNAQKVRFLLAELGQTAELREVPLARPRPDWHLAVNPLGGIPAIVWDGFPLAESNTVLRFLATRSGDTSIYPSDLPDRATVNWLLDAVTTSLRPALRPIERAARGPDGSERDAEAALAAALPTLQAFERLIDDSSPWACCGRFTIADVAATPVLHRLRRSGLSPSGIPRLAEWSAACCERPAWMSVAAAAGI